MKFYVSSAFLNPPEIIEIAKAADELGYDGIGIPDHVVNLETLQTPYPYTKDGQRRWQPFTDWPDPWVLVGALTQVTRRPAVHQAGRTLVGRAQHELGPAPAVCGVGIVMDNHRRCYRIALADYRICQRNRARVTAVADLAGPALLAAQRLCHRLDHGPRLQDPLFVCPGLDGGVDEIAHGLGQGCVGRLDPIQLSVVARALERGAQPGPAPNFRTPCARRLSRAGLPADSCPGTRHRRRCASRRPPPPR